MPPGDPLQQFATEYTVSKLKNGPTRDRVEAAVRKLHVLTNDQTPATEACRICQGGSLAVAFASELLPIQALLSTLPEEDRQSLRERAETYRNETLPFRNGRLHEVRVACPFAMEGGCLIHGERPFGCRLGNGPGPDMKTRELGIGHALGLALSGVDHVQIELGMAIPALLGDGSWVDRYLSGDSVLWEAAFIPPGRDMITEFGKETRGVREPSGFPVDLPAVAEAQDLIRGVDFTVGMSNLRGPSALEQLYRIQVPLVYDSEDEIDEWTGYFQRVMREVASMEFEPGDAFDALKARAMFSLPYQGRDVTSLFEEHGRTIIAPIVERALPDLVRPIEGTRKPGKLRVGYLSRNIRFNSASTWALGWIRNHGPDIESFVFSTNELQDDWNLKFRQGADHYYHVPGDVPSTARFIKSLDLDVLIFTDIGQVSWNYMYAGMRLARTQCTAWGFPVTSGLPTIDYYLSSELMEPPNGDDHYTEKLVRLPGSGLCLDRPDVKPATRSRSDYGLPDGPLIGVLQSVMKCVPLWDDLFVRINEATGAKIVFVDHDYPAATFKTRQRLASAGVDTLWMPRMPADDFHEMLSMFDVLLDPPAWSGGITTLAAIARGKAIVTLPGEFMRGRLSLAFMSQANMGGLIAEDGDQYVRLAADFDLQRSVMKEADVSGPFDDSETASALNKWLLSTV